MKKINTAEPLTLKKEVKIGKTVYRVTSVFGGQQELKKILLDWAVNKGQNAS